MGTGEDARLRVYVVDAAISTLETTVRTDPLENMTHALCSNLRCLYDLASDDATALKRKDVVRKLANVMGRPDLASALS